MNLVRLAARNNAHLVQRICEAHGCAVELTEEFLICLDTPPRFYSQLVTLKEGIFESVVGKVKGPVKDSFHDVDLAASGFNLLFEAEWIWKNPSRSAAPSLRWSKVESDSDLQRWESCWAEGDDEASSFPRQFPASILEYPDLSFFSAWIEGEIAGGVLFNESPQVVGVSNAFGRAVEENVLWADIAALAHFHFPSMPLAGYQRGGSLLAANHAGFESIGPLRVWVPRE